MNENERHTAVESAAAVGEMRAGDVVDVHYRTANGNGNVNVVGRLVHRRGNVLELVPIEVAESIPAKSEEAEA